MQEDPNDLISMTEAVSTFGVSRHFLRREIMAGRLVPVPQPTEDQRVVWVRRADVERVEPRYNRHHRQAMRRP